MIDATLLMLAQLSEPTLTEQTVALATNSATNSTSNLTSNLTILKVLGLFVVGAVLVLRITWRISTVHLALGFAATAAMWAVGYLAMLEPGMWLGDVLFALMLAVPVLMGVVAQRAGASALKSGLVCAFANLLIIGAFLRDEQHGSQLAPALYLIGLFVALGGLAALGGFFARRARPITLPATTGLFALVTALTIFILLITGGLVTGMESGLAVPDWPNSFGHNMLLYPLSEMKGGVFYEHAHRLFGMLVGTTALVLSGVVFREEQRRWVRGLTILLLVIVCVQGLLGGLRVTGSLTSATSGSELTPSTLLAIVHGMFGQIVFATACVLACVTSRAWNAAIPAVDIRGASTVRALPLVLLCGFLVQLFLGASYRHLQTPPTELAAAVHPAWPIWGHVAGAAVMLVLAVSTGAYVSSRASALKPVRILGKGLVHAVGVQIALGVAALVLILMRESAAIPTSEVIVTTVHQAFGALLLAMAAMLAAWSLRLVAPVV